MKRSEAEKLLKKLARQYKKSQKRYWNCRHWLGELRRLRKEYPEELKPQGHSLLRIYMNEESKKMEELKPKILKLKKALDK